METDDSSGMNHSKDSGETGGDARYTKKRGSLTTRAITTALHSVDESRKTRASTNYWLRPNFVDDSVDESDDQQACKLGVRLFEIQACCLRRQQQRSRTQNINLANKYKTMFLLTVLGLPMLLLLPTCIQFAHAGFWTFYFPNFLKPSGYNELDGMISSIESEINATKDAFADTQYFWGMMQQLDQFGEDESSFYPEDSVCAEVFPLFRDLAIEYTYIDYEHFIQPLLDYHEHLKNQQALWFPEDRKGKTILPREWEQKLYEKDLSLKIIYHTKLTNGDEYKQKREQLANIWRSVKRSLDSSLPCIYLRYAVRQVADDIDQEALETNLERMNEAMELVKSAYKRIENFSGSDEIAKKEIDAVLERENRYESRS